MWNYSFVLPDFLILLIFVIYYFIHPRLNSKLNHSFLQVLLADFFVILSDIVASLALENPSHFSPFILRLLNVLYFILFMFRIFSFFIFTEDVIGIRRNKKSPVYILANIIFATFETIALINIFCDTIFSISPSGEYSRTSFYNIIYVCAAFYLILSLGCILHYRKRISRSFKIPVLAFNLVMIAGYISRFAFPRYLIMNLFTLLAIVIIFISYENPIMYLAGKANAFNKKAMFAVFNEIDPKRPPFVLGFVINNYNELREIYSGTQMDKGIQLICQYLAKIYPNLQRFYLHDGRFVLVGGDKAHAEKIKDVLTERFKSAWSAENEAELYLEPKFVQIDPQLNFKAPGKVLKAISAALKEAENLDNVNIIINNETLNVIEQNTQIKRSVEKAVETNSVEMFLQPLMDSKDNKLVGAEALARIRDDDGKLIPPVKFIPIAERNGRINILGEQMFEKACKFLRENDIEKLGLSWINVNLSPIQFLRPDLNQRFSKILEKYNVDAERIHLEITEESMIDYALLQKQINTMRNTGFQFVLDDYGSGYSNVTRLKKCPFINIKLDMELVRDYEKSHDSFLPTLVQSFKQMGFTVTAEGVETLEMVENMAKIGCDYLQGYYFSKPLPAEEFAKTYGK